MTEGGDGGEEEGEDGTDGWRERLFGEPEDDPTDGGQSPVCGAETKPSLPSHSSGGWRSVDRSSQSLKPTASLCDECASKLETRSLSVESFSEVIVTKGGSSDRYHISESDLLDKERLGESRRDLL